MVLQAKVKNSDEVEDPDDEDQHQSGESMYFKTEEQKTHQVMLALLEVPAVVQLGAGHPPFNIALLAVGTGD